MPRRERFRLKRGLLDVLLGDSEWDLARINLLLGEFPVPALDGHNWGEELSERLSSMTDEDLVEMYAIATDSDPAEVEVAFESDQSGSTLWKQGYVRLFLSHSAEHKVFVSEVAEELAVVGIDGFVAHETMEVAAPWQAQIEQALRSMDAFVALVHPGFGARSWCQQEVGWAFGRRVPMFAVRLGEDPTAFLGSTQWPSANGSPAKKVAEVLSEWVSGLADLGETVVSGLITALGSAKNYFDAEAAAQRIAALGSVDEATFRRIDEVWWQNNQLHGGFLPSRVMSAFYEANGREWPPPKDEEPF